MASGAGGRFEKLVVAHRLEQIVQRVDSESVQGMVGVGRREDYAGVRRYFSGQLEAVEMRHMDVQEYQVRRLGEYRRQGILGTMVFAGEAEEGRALYVRCDQRCRKGLVVDHDAAQYCFRIHAFSVSVALRGAGAGTCRGRQSEARKMPSAMVVLSRELLP